ncbi:MAG: hypothetical protein ACERKN_21370 [Velocimicrobium sp.]
MKEKIALLSTFFLMFTIVASGCSNTVNTEGTLSEEKTGTRIVIDALDLVAGVELGETPAWK